MDIDEAIKTHLTWKAAFRTAIAARSKIDLTLVGNDQACALGHWLHGEAEHLYPRLHSYWDCVIAHSELHLEANRIARLISQGKYEEAQVALERGTPYSAASNKIIVALKLFEAEARL